MYVHLPRSASGQLPTWLSFPHVRCKAMRRRIEAIVRSGFKSTSAISRRFQHFLGQRDDHIRPIARDHGATSQPE